MSVLNRLYYLVRADVLERLRRRSFLIVLGIVVYAAYMFLPANHTKIATLQIGMHRGVYNSAWVGSLVAVMSAVYIGMLGFYLVKSGLARDSQTRVGEILAATPMSRLQYVYVKMLSNAAVLSVMVAVVAIAAAGMQIVRGESLRLAPLDLVMPFVVFTFPTLLLVSAVAVLFEAVRFLRGGIGNVVYFFLWVAAIATITTSIDSMRTRNDPMGLGILIPTVKQAAYQRFDDLRSDSSGVSMGFHIRRGDQVWDLKTFEWEGMHWSADMLGQRAVWPLLALLLTVLSAAAFDRFDPARGVVAVSVKKRKKGKRQERAAANGEVVVNGAAKPGEWGSAAGLSPVVARVQRSRFGTLLVAELKLCFKGANRLWYLVALGLFVAGLLAPLDVGRRWLLPVAWIWPLLIWSALGVREERYGTAPLMFSSPRPVARQLPAVWMAGFVVAAVCGGGVGLRLVIAGDIAGLGAWIAAALLIPSFALACGVWTGGSKLFEVLYLIVWYVGPMSAFPYLDFTGGTAESIAMGVPLGVVVAAVGLTGLAYLGRQRQLRLD